MHTLQETLEAYDTGAYPFNENSDAHDLRKEIDAHLEERIEEEVSAKVEEAVAEQVRDAAAAHLEAFDNLQEKIEEEFPSGAASDIVALLTEHLPREE